MISELMEAVSDITNHTLGQYLAEPLAVVDGERRLCALKTSETATSYPQFGVEVNVDDRVMRLSGGGATALNPAKAAPFILKQFSGSNGFSGVALHLAADGRLTVSQSYDMAGAGTVSVPLDVLERLLERGIASTAFLSAMVLLTNLVDSGIAQEAARDITRDVFGLYMPLFAGFGVAGFLEPEDDDSGTAE